MLSMLLVQHAQTIFYYFILLNSNVSDIIAFNYKVLQGFTRKRGLLNIKLVEC